MFNPFVFDMYAKSHHTELLKEAAQSRAARAAQGDTAQRGARIRTIAFSLAAVAVGLILVMAIL